MIPTRRGPVAATATRVIIAVTVGVYLLQVLGLRDVLYENLAQFNLAIEDGQWWLIFTPVLVHATGFTHILFNMWALWVLGPQIERGIGTAPFVALYLASAGVGGVFVFVLGDPLTLAVGASGAIFGLFGVWLNWAVHRRNTTYGRALLRQIGFLLLLNAALPFIIRAIAWEAHLGGLIAGFVIGEIWSRLGGRSTVGARTSVGAAVAVVAALLVLVL